MGTCNGHLQCLIFWFGTLITYRLLTDDVLLRQLCADWTSANCTTAECSGCPVFEQLVEVATQELLPCTSTNDTAESIRGTVKEFWISLKDPGIDGSSLVKVFSVLVDGTIDRRDYNKLVGLRPGQKRLKLRHQFVPIMRKKTS